jgi:predicted aspartyl protease
MLNGHVDEKLRALVPIRIASTNGQNVCDLWAWVDTAFNGSLVVPGSAQETLDLIVESTAEAILADWTKVQLETFGCQIEWFGTRF